MTINHLKTTSFVSLILIQVSCSSSPKWQENQERRVVGGDILYTGKGEDRTYELSKIRAEGDAISMIMKECGGFPHKEMKIWRTDHEVSTLGSHKSYAEASLSFTYCEQAKKVDEKNKFKLTNKLFKLKHNDYIKLVGDDYLNTRPKVIENSKNDGWSASYFAEFNSPTYEGTTGENFSSSNLSLNYQGKHFGYEFFTSFALGTTSGSYDMNGSQSGFGLYYYFTEIHKPDLSVGLHIQQLNQNISIGTDVYKANQSVKSLSITKSFGKRSEGWDLYARLKYNIYSDLTFSNLSSELAGKNSISYSFGALVSF